MTHILSKSKFTEGLQCHKLLWWKYHRKEDMPPYDEQTLARFLQGHEVGALAKLLFPNGIEVGGDPGDFAGILQRSTALLAERKPLFEAGFRHAGGFARVDILDPVGRDQWDLIEVKSSTKLKDVNLEDIAFQRFVYEGAGIRVRKTRLMLVNNKYVRQGELEPHKFFETKDVTAEVKALLPRVKEKMAAMAAVLASKEPKVNIGPQCTEPHRCPMKDLCWSKLPRHHVFTLRLYRKARAWGLYRQGVEDLTRLPTEVKLNANQQIQVEAVATGKVHVDKAGLRKFMARLKYPLHFLDFETFNPAIPPFEGTRPSQQIPFQFSLHVVDREGAKPRHHEFLAEGTDDPRLEMMRRLVPLIGGVGSVLAHYATFEKGRIEECCAALPEFMDWWKGVKPRIVDTEDPFKAFSYYHPEQIGSTSLKKVLPAVTGKNYKGLGIQEGNAAVRQYLAMTRGNLSDAEKAKIRKDLLAYCSLDTLAMVLIVDRLRELAQ